MKDEESLKAGALISKLPDAIQNKIDNFFANCVMTTSIIVSSIYQERQLNHGDSL
jgi:hypothetical protein